MKLHQIVIRPDEHTVFVLYLDALNTRNSVVFDSAGNATVDKLLAECQQKLPADSENPSKPQVLQEITALEDRLRLLKQSIGQA
jgi:hypothetical protein